MTSGDLANLLSQLLRIPVSTIALYGRHLRAADLVNVKGYGRGAAQMTPRDAAVYLVALCVDHERGGDFVREVKRVLALPLSDTVVTVASFGDDLLFSKAHTAGEAITALFTDAITPRFAKQMRAREEVFTVHFDAEGAFLSVSLTPKTVDEVFYGGGWTYQRGTYDDRKRRNIERLTVLHSAVFHDIAKAMGVIPPPPA